jgi:hypothetical protein
MLRNGKDVRPLGLPIPARDPRQPMGDVVEFNIKRGGVEQIEPPTGEHTLPGARR